MANQTATLCWTCRNACGGCSWTEVDKATNKVRFQPVKGWVATKTRVLVNSGPGQTGRCYDTSYIVRFCPLYEADGGGEPAPAEGATAFSYCVYPRLKSALRKKRYTHKSLADAVGLSQSGVRSLLIGRNARSIAIIKAFLGASGLTFEEAFEKARDGN